VEEPEDPHRGWQVAAEARTEEERRVLFEQYKLATEMADRISSRRGTANGFYFTINSALLAASESLSLALASGAGIALAAAWWLQLRSYRNLNAAKWQVIAELESRLPAHPFADEWAILKKDGMEEAALASGWLTRALQPLARYAELSLIEQVVPLVFLILFAVTLGLSA
jgi:hypothetical protein